MSDGVIAALITGLLSLAGVLATLYSRQSRAGVQEVRRLRSELGQLRLETERYRTAYEGLLELTCNLLRDGDDR